MSPSEAGLCFSQVSTHLDVLQSVLNGLQVRLGTMARSSLGSSAKLSSGSARLNSGEYRVPGPVAQTTGSLREALTVFRVDGGSPYYEPIFVVDIAVCSMTHRIVSMCRTSGQRNMMHRIVSMTICVVYVHVKRPA